MHVRGENIMEKELISVIDAARQLGKYKQTLFKIIRKLKITPTRQRHSEHGGQAISYITMEEFDRITEYFSTTCNSIGETKIISSPDSNLTDIKASWGQSQVGVRSCNNTF